MSKFSLSQSGRPVFRPADEASNSASVLLVVAFFALVGLLLVAIRSIGASQKPTPSPSPATTPGTAVSGSITKALMNLPTTPPFVP